MSLTGIGLIVIPISSASACALPIGNKVQYEVILNKYNKYKKQNERDQPTIKFFDKLYKKSLQDNVIDKTEYQSLCKKFLLNMLTKTKKILFYKHEYKNKIKHF